MLAVEFGSVTVLQLLDLSRWRRWRQWWIVGAQRSRWHILRQPVGEHLKLEKKRMSLPETY